MGSESLGTWRHLVARFFRSLGSQPLGPEECTRIHQWATAAELALFFAQPAIDQRHGFESAAWVEAGNPDRTDLVRAALLHDIGKRHARLGVAARVAASLVLRLGLPARGRIATYRDHGRLAAAELSGLGAEPLVVAFAHAHHRERPPSITEADWRLLQEADHA